MSRFGIHFRLILAAFMLISATTFALGYIGAGIIQQFIQTRFEERMAFLAKYLALNAELGILIDERAMLKRLAQNLLSEKDVIKVVIRNNADEILTDVSKTSQSSPLFPYLALIDVPVVLKELRDESLTFQWNTNDKPDGEIIGKVQITYSTQGINKLLSAITTRFIWISMGLAGLCVLIFYFISRSLVSPVTNLAHAVRRVAAGDLELRVIPSNLPETRELGIAFNAMLDFLEKSRKTIEEANRQMIRQKTLAEMGKFSLMIAHEVKNPLSIIKTSLDILKKDIGQSSENTMIAYMEDEIRRLNRLIEDFLLFAKPATPMFRSVDMNVLLAENLENYLMRLGQISDASVRVQTDISKIPCHINADSDLLIRAIDNIIKNAFESNEYKGVVTVRTFCQSRENEGIKELKSFDKERVQKLNFLHKESSYWIVEIEDQGNGIASEHMNKIFEPFFTTRSKGTGLGLAFASQVVNAHNGIITAKNTKNKGALFQIRIPIRDEC